MNTHQVVQRLKAFEQGKALPRGETLHFRIANDPDILLVAFVRMGGESAPWAVGFGHPGARPTILTVPEARNRDLVAGMAAQFAPALLKHLRHPDHTREQIVSTDHAFPLRRVCVPNASHLEMFHHLAYAYTFTRWGPADRALLLNSLGRAGNWLFQESQRPGQQTVMVATEALRESFTFPADDIRQGHLGFLLAWLTTRGGRQARLEAAAAAEEHSIATSLDPEVERSQLEPFVTRWNDAGREEDERRKSQAARPIAAALTSEVERRLRLLEEAMTALRGDRRRVNTGVSDLETTSRSEHWYSYLRLERQIAEGGGRSFIPSPETDRSAPAAAARFFMHEESAEQTYAVLIHDDREIQADAIAEGDAFQGTITDVRDDTPVGRKRTPVWTIQSPDSGQLRLREGSHVCLVGTSGRQGSITAIDRLPSGGRQFEVTITGWKNARPAERVRSATDNALAGHRVIMVSASFRGLGRTRIERVWRRDVPGAWLTHAAVPPAYEAPDDMAVTG